MNVIIDVVLNQYQQNRANVHLLAVLDTHSMF